MNYNTIWCTGMCHMPNTRLIFFVFKELWITQSSFIFISKYVNINKNLTGYKHNSQIYSI